MVKKYRKKPVVIEAMQFTGNLNDLKEFVPSNLLKINNTEITIATLEGHMTIRISDFIIQGVQGEFYPCKPDIFFATYEAVEEK